MSTIYWDHVAKNKQLKLFNLFRWLKRYLEALTCLLEEIEIFTYHYKTQSQNMKKKNSSWFRNYIYSMTQFLIRTNLKYYFFHVFLRDDHKHTLIAYSHALRTNISRKMKNERSKSNWRLNFNITNLSAEREKFDL